MTTKEAKELVHQFENGDLPKEKWTHEAHFVMAFWYCCQQPLPQAIESIKEGIKKYNISVGGGNTDHSGYHETITVFYIIHIIYYVLQTSENKQFESRLNGLWQQEFLKKDFLFKYYSRGLLMSKEARKNWLGPDLQPFFAVY